MTALYQLGKASPVVVLACLVWWEVHLLRQDLGEVKASLAVVVDRACAPLTGPGLPR